VPSTTPQQSVRGFVSPSSMPIKKTPDITDICGEQLAVSGNGAESNVGATFTVAQEQKAENDVGATFTVAQEPAHHTPHTAPDFPTHWHTMFNQVFASVPTIYIPLKESLPEIENNIIKVTVKNDVQKEHFEAKTREVLEFLRTHFDEQIEDIVVETNEKLETKKIIYDVKEKLQNFKEQNSEIEDFIQILDLKIKD
jgi:hypothetical protein